MQKEICDNLFKTIQDIKFLTTIDNPTKDLMIRSLEAVMLFMRAPHAQQGTGDTEIPPKQHKPRFRLFNKNQEPKDFYTLHEIADHLKLSYSCINRIRSNKNKANRKCFEYLKDIKIIKIEHDDPVCEEAEEAVQENGEVTLNFN